MSADDAVLFERSLVAPVGDDLSFEKRDVENESIARIRLAKTRAARKAKRQTISLDALASFRITFCLRGQSLLQCGSRGPSTIADTFFHRLSMQGVWHTSTRIVVMQPIDTSLRQYVLFCQTLATYNSPTDQDKRDQLPVIRDTPYNPTGLV